MKTYEKKIHLLWIAILAILFILTSAFVIQNDKPYNSFNPQQADKHPSSRGQVQTENQHNINDYIKKSLHKISIGNRGHSNVILLDQ